MQGSDTLPIYPDLAGKVAVVTCGSGGIGAATCRLLAANGAKVVVNGGDQARIEAVVDAIRAAGGQAVGVAADCTDLAAVQRLRQQAEQALGPAELLAAFVGGGRARPGPIAEITEEDWRSTVDGILTATFLTLKSFLPGMVQRGRGAIVTMASSAARLPGLEPVWKLPVQLAGCDRIVTVMLPVVSAWVPDRAGAGGESGSDRNRPFG
jgi:3-oxoacyl-[acyl-carrier protein] reductase